MPRRLLAREPSPFDAVWSRFTAAPTTLGPTPGAREAWHLGRPRYAVWVLRVEDPAVLSRHAAMLDVLAPHGARPFTDPHITLFVAGFPTAAPERDDDVAHTTLEAQVAALRAADPLAPCLHVGGLNAFLSCPFLEVHAPAGGLDALRSPLERALLAHDRREVRFAPYVPHFTVGPFGDTRPTRPVAAAIAGLRSLPPLPFRPSALELVTFDTAAMGPLTTVARVELRTEP
ncbi:MAG: 2'-5' RNA ligase family protein [Pseudomonadota bacterium]|nr:2'-5' RNA ligase family protein [Pseudomonadota bacterium]